MIPMHRRYIFRETAVSVAVNSLLSIVFALLATHGKAAVPLWGVRGMAVDFVPQTFMVSLATTIAVTIIARKRIRAGTVSPLPVDKGGPFVRMPRHPLGRALSIASIAAVVLSPLGAGVLDILEVTSLPTRSFVMMKALYGAALALLVSPPIVRAALALPLDHVGKLTARRQSDQKRVR
jgi:hypothetical protein